MSSVQLLGAWIVLSHVRLRHERRPRRKPKKRRGTDAHGEESDETDELGSSSMGNQILLDHAICALSSAIDIRDHSWQPVGKTKKGRARTIAQPLLTQQAAASVCSGKHRGWWAPWSEFVQSGSEIGGWSEAVHVGSNPEGQQIGSLWISSQVLGFGSAGTIVFRGQLGSRQVAVKRILKPFVQVAAQEVSSLISSDVHANVVRYFTQESDKDFIYLALELCDCTLAEVIENKLHPVRYGAKFVSKVQVREITKQVLAGLNYLHSQQIVHRDLKPQNILLKYSLRSAEGGVQVKLSDMGLSKRLDVEQASFYSWGQGSIGWRAPETLAGERLTKAVDIFSVGCLVHYMLSDGLHLFGDGIDIERNISRGHAVRLKEFAMQQPEASALVEAAVHLDVCERLPLSQLSEHVFLWDDERRLLMVEVVSDCCEHNLLLAQDLDSRAARVFNTSNGWVTSVDRKALGGVLDGGHRRYHSSKLSDLVRFMRNVRHHFHDLAPSGRQLLGGSSSLILVYFDAVFPALILECAQTPLLRGPSARARARTHRHRHRDVHAHAGSTQSLCVQTSCRQCIDRTRLELFNVVRSHGEEPAVQSLLISRGELAGLDVQAFGKSK
jgi:serine/threonine-protein kinase/endoribonuclease IRE1